MAGQGHFAKIFEAIKVGDRKESSQSTVAVKYLLGTQQFYSFDHYALKLAYRRRSNEASGKGSKYPIPFGTSR